ncbi:MAG: glycosyltransferase [Planctomycetaceae bacterium]|nr:glycosyltransferase [Planctomycetaceae bacterium]
MRVAVLFDDRCRPETTGVYCHRALQELAGCGRVTEVDHIRPLDLSRSDAPADRWDLIIAVDDGLDYDLPSAVAPTAWWAIDTHLNFKRAWQRARQARWTFAAQRNGAEQLQQQGIDAVWLPLACDPELHGRQTVENLYDWSFVGHLFPGERQRLVHELVRRYRRSCVGNYYFAAMAAVYSASKCVFNRSLVDDINMRVFEGLCSGSLLVTNDLAERGLAELFQDGVHLATYQSDEELFDKISYYLTHQAARERIAANGRAEVLARHTYRHRMERLLDVVAGRGNTRAIKDTSSWLDEIDFGIKTFLRPQALKRLFSSIDAHYPAARVTIVDDGGLTQADDEDSQFCRDLLAAHPHWRLVSLPFDSGVSAGRNALVAETDRPYLLLLDDDFCFTADTRIERLWERLTAEPTLDVAAGMCVDWVDGGRQPRQSGGVLERRGTVLVHTMAAGDDEGAGRCDYFPHFALFRRTVFSRVAWRGGVGGEHYDFCLQLQERGMSAIQDPTVVIDHHPTTPALDGYAARRWDFAAAQQEFLQRWNLERVVQDGVTIVERTKHTDHSLPLKSTTYFEFDRPDVQELVPVTARRILDIGCGAGRLGAALKARQPAHVTGVEWNPGAAAIARTQLDDVRNVNLETDDVQFAESQFDCVICADILEHLRQPERLLKKIRRWLAPEGALVVSVPNVRNHTVVGSLLAGNWTYESAGLLDADHVRFFTRRELEKLLFRTGFVIDDWRMVPGEGFAEWHHEGQPSEISVGGLQIRAASAADAAEFFAYQYLVRAVPQPFSSPTTPGADGLTSIVLVTWNQQPYTQMCLDSLRLRTDEPYELIVVDNGSTDGTVEWLRAQPDIRLIENTENRGFPAAVNQGLRIARGEHLLLLNNDTILTTGWLRRMLDVLHSDRTVGLVGPTSNYVGSDQEIPVDYTRLANLDGFAWARHRRLVEWGEPLVQETDRLIGFCLLFKREVLDAVGGLDERFGIGCFEDDDFCRRARLSGYRAMIARAAFIHHFGSVTFQASGANLGALLRKNQRVYEQKWNEEGVRPGTGNHQETAWGERLVANGTNASECHVSAPQGAPRPAVILAQDADGNLIIAPNSVRLSGCLIVRDNETTIRACLESLKPWVDELIVVDTGSTDATPRIAEEIGARVFPWAWRDDFAAARNVSLDRARGEWLFWMDSDDVISEDCGRKLHALANGDHPDERLGYVMQVHCPGDDPTDVTVVDHVKLFRNRPDLRFEFRIHEQILPAIRRAGGEVAFTEIYVVHAGYDRSRDGQAKKLERDFKLLHRELGDRPDHPFVLFNLGMTHADCGQHAQAIGRLQRCLDVSGPDESHVRKAYALLIHSLLQTQRLDEAEQVCHQGRTIFPDDKELLFRQAMLKQQQGRLEAAVASYHEVLSITDGRHFTSVDAGLGGFKARHNLAILHEELEDFESAVHEWRRITEEQRDYAPAWRGLIDALAKLGRAEDIAPVSAAVADDPHPRLRSVALYGAGRQFELRGETDQALALFAAADRLDPQEPAALHQTCRLLFEAGRWSRARESLEELQRRQPEDASVLHNLGIVYWHVAHPDEAVKAFRQSLRLRPHSEDTRRALEAALQKSGREVEAGECRTPAPPVSGDRPRGEFVPTGA